MKKYRSMILTIIPVLILVFYWQFGRDHFRSDARRLAEPSMTGANIIDENQFSSLSGNKLLVLLDSCKAEPDVQHLSVMEINAGKILSESNLKLIRDNNGPVLLFSCEKSLSARIWMILSQMGIRDLYILSEKSDSTE
jgi:hypothetical protein